MKINKNFIEYKSGTLDSFLIDIKDRVNKLSNSLTNETPIMHTFLKDAGYVIITVSDEKKTELGLPTNILKKESIDYYPLGMSHQHLTEYREILVGKNSSFESFDDIKNYAAAVIENSDSDKIIIIRLIDKKFTNKLWYVIPSTFSSSKYLEINAVIIGDATLGESVANTLGTPLKVSTDGIVI